MAFLNLFSHRMGASQEKDSPFVFDTIPQALRVQIAHIMCDAIGRFYLYGGYDFETRRENNQGWQTIHDIVARERGLFSLSEETRLDKCCVNYLLRTRRIEHVLDLVEVAFAYIHVNVRRLSAYHRKQKGIKVTADQAINELNQRFMRARIGYQFDGGKIVRVDSEMAHREITRPAFHLLNKPGFEGPNDEFLRAHAHFRSGEMKDAIIDACNSFESTLKVICDQRGWTYDKGARASDLIRVVRKRGLLPAYLDRSFDQLVATLKSGLPTVRNEEGAHGQGAECRSTPNYVAAYALHLTASAILFLVGAHRDGNLQVRRP